MLLLKLLPELLSSIGAAALVQAELFKKPELYDELRLDAYGGLLEKTELPSSVDEQYARYGVMATKFGINSWYVVSIVVRVNLLTGRPASMAASKQSH